MKSILTGIIIFFIATGAAFAQGADYRIQPTDILNISVYQQPDLTTKTRVTADGDITLPLLCKIAVKGLTITEVEQKIKQLLEKDYLVNAQVLVFIEEYHPRQVSVMGEVNKPGKFDMPAEKDMTIMQAIAMAGGFTKDANIDKTVIMRIKNGMNQNIKIKISDITVRGKKEKDIILEPDDIIFIPESFF